MMAGRECKEMQAALKAYDNRKAGTTVLAIATKAGVSRAGLYYALERRKAATSKGK